MIISVVNHTSGKLADEEVLRAVRAVNRQIAEDFEPYWGMGARLRLEAETGHVPDKLTLPELRGDAVLYLWDKAEVDEAVGYHETNLHGIPFGFVFLEVATALGEPWTATLSHEALEIIADPYVNLLVMGPHPTRKKTTVFHWFEMCDAVQAEVYEIDGLAVSNFVLPLYFTPDSEGKGRNDFLGTLAKGKSLASFGVNPGGYIGFYDPQTKEHATYARRSDKQAHDREEKKERLLTARRAARYGRYHRPNESAKRTKGNERRSRDAGEIIKKTL